jgi:hypothetical protein
VAQEDEGSKDFVRRMIDLMRDNDRAWRIRRPV